MKNIAVIIPSYKPGKYIEKCLLSLENQTIAKEKYTVYIGLNGPKEYFESYILTLLSMMSFKSKYIYISEKGVSRARNELLDISDEEYIVFIDDDDLISSNYLQNLLEVASMKYMGISNIYNFKNDLNNLKQNYIGKSFLNLKNNETSLFKTRKYFSSPMAKILHRNMIGNIRFDIKLFRNEDSFFMAMISKNVSGINKSSKDTCYYVQERQGSLTRQKINLKKELKTYLYLIFQYTKLFFKKDYEKLFISTRIAATLLKLIKILGNEK